MTTRLTTRIVAPVVKPSDEEALRMMAAATLGSDSFADHVRRTLWESRLSGSIEVKCISAVPTPAIGTPNDPSTMTSCALLLELGHLMLQGLSGHALAEACATLPGPRILCARLSGDEMHALNRYAACLAAELLVFGLDSPDQLADLVVRHPTPEQRREEHVVLSVPLALDKALREARCAPWDWSVKRLAAESGMSRRSLERHFRRALDQSPAAVLRAIRSGLPHS